MIICISANPAIDRRLRVGRLNVGEVNRAASAQSFAGGKAAHVAMAATALGQQACWIGFLGGSTGDLLESQLSAIGIEVVAVRTSEPTRINDEIIDHTGTVTEILEPGGPVSEAELAQFYAACTDVFESQQSGFQAVLSGSLPPNVPDDLYAELTRAARNSGGYVILDASGTALLSGIGAEPDLVKPNMNEASAAAGVAIVDEKDAVLCIRRLQSSGARGVALSLGADGIIWSAGGSGAIYAATPPGVDVVSTVGCGDASVAGFAVGRSLGLDGDETLRLAVACGTANCLASLPGQISGDDVQGLRQQVAVRCIEPDS